MFSPQFLPKRVRPKLVPWLLATSVIGFLPLGVTPAAQAQTVIYNGRTIIEDRDRDDDDRYDRYDRYDNYDRSDRYDRYDNYDYSDRYDNNDRYGRSDRYGRYENYDRYENDDRYNDYDRFDHSDHDGFSRRRHTTIIERRPFTGQSNPACLAFQSIRIACR